MDEEEFLPLSGLQHLLFCERQCALIHVEGLWVDNALTVLGGQLHDRTDLPGVESGPDVRVVRALSLRCSALRLVGRADVVEFHRERFGDGRDLWRPFPVEYKRGKRRAWLHNEVQLCAQGMALEEMCGVPVPRGALYYGASRRRLDVELNESLRSRTRAAAERLHEIVRLRLTPRAQREPKCNGCSFLPICLPEATSSATSAALYLQSIYSGVTAAPEITS